MSITQAKITSHLDEIESSLPTIPSKTVAFGRATARRTTSITTAVVGEVSDRVRSAAKAVNTAAQTTTGQARSAAERSAKTVRSGIAETTGQAAAQAERALDAVEAEAAGLIGDATNAVDPAPRNPASLNDLTKAQLYSRAQELDIEGRASMSKRQLITALRK